MTDGFILDDIFNTAIQMTTGAIFVACSVYCFFLIQREKRYLFYYMIALLCIVINVAFYVVLALGRFGFIAGLSPELLTALSTLRSFHVASSALVILYLLKRRWSYGNGG